MKESQNRRAASSGASPFPMPHASCRMPPDSLEPDAVTASLHRRDVVMRGKTDRDLPYTTRTARTRPIRKQRKSLSKPLSFLHSVQEIPA